MCLRPVPFTHGSIEMNTLIDDPVVRIFPNPFTDRLTVEASGVNPSLVTIEITNSLGQLCLHQKISGFPATLNTSNLKAGIYTISFKYGDRLLIKKIIHF